MNPSMARKRHQQEPNVPPVSHSLPPCRLSQHPDTESPPNPLHLRPSDPPIPDRKSCRPGRRLAPLQRLCDCCVSPKRRRGPRRPRHNLRFTAVATGAGSTDTADECGRIPHFNPSCNNNSTRTRRRKRSGAPGKAASSSEGPSSAASATESPLNSGIYCSSGCETETLLSTSACGGDEPTGCYFSPCLAKTQSRQASPATAGAAALMQSDTTAPTTATGNGLFQVAANGVEVNALQSQLLHRQLQQRQQHRHAANMGLFCNPGAGQRAAGIFYRAAAEVSAIAAAAGAAAVACECVRHKAAQAAAALHPWSPRTLLPERVAPPSAAAAATIAAISPATEAAACGRKPIPACSADETNGAAAAAAAAAEASRAAFLREELLNLAESRYTAVFVPVDEQLLEQMNDEFIRSDISRYPVKNTPSGIVFYSPRYSDDRFIYRHVLLSAGVKKAAEEIANATKSAFLTEGQFIYQLGIHLSPGWEHFMIFKGEMRELILRRPQQQQESQSSQNQAHSDEVSEESDDSEPEEPITTGAAPESQPPPPRHQELGRLLQQIAENATIHQVRHQKNLLQQQMAISRAVEKANRLLLLIVQLQRPPQHVSPKMLDRMKCLLASYFFSSLSHFSVEEEQQQSTTAKKYLFQNGNIGKQGQLLLLLLQCAAASRQHQQASDAMELLFLQHKLLLQHRSLMQQRVPRISIGGVERHQQIFAPSCAIEAPHELQEKRFQQQEDQEQDRQSQEGQHLNRRNGAQDSCRLDGIRHTNSSCRRTPALRLRKRRGPSLILCSASPLPVATPQTDSLPVQQQGKRQSGCCNAVAAADDGSAGSGSDAAALANVALPRGLAAKGKAPNQPANATGGINSPTSQRREKRRRYPVKR